MPPENPAHSWSPRRTEDGSWTLVHAGHGEACHSLAGARTQARERYARILAELPDSTLAAGSVRLCDIGTGLGLNLAAALEACDARGVSLDAWSFEIDPGVIRAAREIADRDGASESHGRVLAALEQELASPARDADEPARAVPGPGGHRLRLLLGDARVRLPSLPADLRFDAVFLDPFSPRVDPPLWEERFLAEVGERMAPLARLSTYTVALRVRAALARAGLAVGQGPRVGRKAAGTLASRGGPVPPLDARTQRRLARVLELGLARR